jgi:hypothetical protein
MTDMADIALKLTEFQAGEVTAGLDTDAADHPDDPDWGTVVRDGSKFWLIVAGTQQARDRALYRITSARDIFQDNAADPFNSSGERLTYVTRFRSMQILTRALIEACGGAEGFSPEFRRWLRG